MRPGRQRLPGRLRVIAILALAATKAPAGSIVTESADPFAFFQPWIALTPSDRQRLDRGDVLVRILPARDRQLAVFAASTLDATPDTLIERMRAIEELKKSAFVPIVKRFSDPPAIEDLADLNLDDDELEDLRRCRPGDCDLKLSAIEIEEVRRSAAEGGAGWKDAIHATFQRLLLARATVFLSYGLEGLPAYHDRKETMRLQDAFASILAASPYLVERLPAFASALGQRPDAARANTESFLYWSKERFGGKATVTVSHVTILRNEEEAVSPVVLVASTQVFGSHYMNGALGLTAMLRDLDGRRTYLVYLNRTEVDVLGGVFSAWKRAVIEGRIERETGEIFRELRRRIERRPSTGAAHYSPATSENPRS